MQRVLLIEDNSLFAKLVDGLLTQTHSGEFQVTTATSLAGARSCLAAMDQAFDVVILDLSLPETEGLDSLRAVQDLVQDIPIVVLTAATDEQMSVEAVRAGAQDYLIKTQISAGELRRALLYAIERRRTLRRFGRDGIVLEGLLNSMYAAAGVLDSVRDGDGRVIDLRWHLGNATCEAVLGTPARDLVGKTLAVTLPGLAADSIGTTLRAVAAGEQSSCDVEYRLLRRGKPIWLRIAAAQVGDGIGLLATDITARKTQEGQLIAARDAAQRSAQARTQVLNALSHEMRQPLNTIVGFAEMMDSEVLGPIANAQYRAYVKDITRASHDLREILEDIMARSRREELAKVESGYRHLIDLAPDMICVCKQGIITMMNAAGLALLGLRGVDVCVGRPLADFVHSDYRDAVGNGLEVLLKEQSRVPMKLISVDGREVDVEVAATLVSQPDDEASVMVVARDVTERQTATRAILQREERLRKIMETMVDALVIIDEKGIIETFNPAAERVFGYAAAEVIGRSVGLLMPLSDAAHHDDYLRNYMADGRGRVMGIGRDIHARRKNGQIFPTEIALSELRMGNRLSFIAVLRDITERKMSEARLRDLATRDHLTGLPNRAMFRDRLQEAVEQADDQGMQVGVLFIDLDHFKNINDTLGHSIGDRVLQAVASRLEDHVPKNGAVFHLSGDEFTVVLDRLPSAEDAARLASHLLEQLAEPFDVDGREIYTSGSIGIVIYPENAESISNLMKNVDTAVHHAKRTGRNNFQFYTENLSQDMIRRLLIENGLRRALERSEMFVVYQPKVDLDSGRVIGAEALLRWVGGDLGFVSPAEFIPVAEETGLIVSIGEWVLREVCLQIDCWRAAGRTPPRIAVNLSARQFKESGLTNRIMEILGETGVTAEHIELELTESMLVENADDAIQALWALKGLGISLSIDDFGTGYSSLSYLKRFPIDALKIDQSFVRDIPASRDDMSITKAIISMGLSLELKLVAEGVETVEQRDFLRANGCHMAQGYYYAKPLTAFEFDSFLDSHQAALDAANKQLAMDKIAT